MRWSGVRLLLTDCDLTKQRFAETETLMTLASTSSARQGWPPRSPACHR